MNPQYFTAGIALLAIAACNPRPAATAPAGTYAIVDRVPGPPTSLWDYASVDAKAGRLYLAAQGVMALDLKTGKITPQFVPGGRTHGVLVLVDGTVALADATSNTVKFFDGATGRILATIPTGKSPTVKGWHNPDAMVLEPKTGFLVAANGDSSTLVLIDIKKYAVVGTIPIGGKLEFAAADGSGTIYINVETKNAIAVVDIPNRKLVKEISLKDCKDPSGLAYDAADRLVISVCENGLAKFIDATNDTETVSIPVGRGADAVMYDPMRHVAFIPAGTDGTLSVIGVRGPKDVALIQTLTTQPSARLGVIDPRTGRLYLPIVKYDRSAPPTKMPGLEFPTPIPSTFQFLVVEPQ
jgi:DNA-binding beta-propeller fold protein YncE